MLGNWFNEDQYDRFEDDEPSGFDLADWEEMRRSMSEAIDGQLAMFPPDKDFIFRFKEENKINNIQEFNDIIYKNPSYTAWELLDLHEKAESMYAMDDDLDGLS